MVACKIRYVYEPDVNLWIGYRKNTKNLDLQNEIEKKNNTDFQRKVPKILVTKRLSKIVQVETHVYRADLYKKSLLF